MKIHSRVKDYEVNVLDGLLEKKDEILAEADYDQLFFFVDQNVHRIYKDRIEKFIHGSEALIIDARESNKEYIKLAEYYQWLIDRKFTRKDILITIGGGILQDISGFIASTLYRGIKWIFFPTTLLAQADSCIGSKTSINFGDSKNLIGSFYPPDKIFIDSDFCDTLQEGYFHSGIGEIIKFHLLSNLEGYEKLKKYIFSDDLKNKEALSAMTMATLNIKRSYFEEDEFDTGRRNLLNYGHCFGHALESASNFAVSHGQAVLVGMAFADLLSLKRRVLSKQRYQEFQKIYERFFPKYNLGQIAVEELIKYLKKDKKRTGADLTMVIAEDVGRFHKCDDVKVEEVAGIYESFQKDYENFTG